MSFFWGPPLPGAHAHGTPPDPILSLFLLDEPLNSVESTEVAQLRSRANRTGSRAAFGLQVTPSITPAHALGGFGNQSSPGVVLFPHLRLPSISKFAGVPALFWARAHPGAIAPRRTSVAAVTRARTGREREADHIQQTPVQ